MATASFIKRTKDRIAGKSVLFNENGCIKWVGITTGVRVKYRKVKVKFPNDARTKYYYTHRVAFMLHHNVFETPRHL